MRWKPLQSKVALRKLVLVHIIVLKAHWCHRVEQRVQLWDNNSLSSPMRAEDHWRGWIVLRGSKVTDLKHKMGQDNCNPFTFCCRFVDVLLHNQFLPSFSCQSDRLTCPHIYFGLQRSSWLTRWLQGAQGLCLQRKARLSPLYHRADSCFVLLCCVWFSPSTVH